MALPFTNISTPMVRTILGAPSTYGIHALCNHVNINKWSKFKPVVHTWPAMDGSYGMNRGNDWSYYPRITGTLGQFAGYEPCTNFAFPPILSIESENLVRTINPTGGTTDYNTFYIRAYKTLNDVMLDVSSLGLNDYYYGLKIVNTNGTYYKTYGKIRDMNHGAQHSMTIQSTLQNPTTSPSFSDCPYGVGSYTYTLVICSSTRSTWSTSAPPQVINFPTISRDVSTTINTGSFTVTDWIYVATTDMAWSYNQSVLSGDGSTYVYTSNTGTPIWAVQSKPAWITVDVYDNTWHAYPDPNDWQSGYFIRLTPDANYGASRNGVVTLIGSTGTTEITVQQTAYPSGVTYIWNHDSGATGYDITPNSHGMSVGSSNFDLNFDHTFVGDDYKYWSISATPSGASASGGPGSPGGVRLRTGITAVKSGTLDANIADGDTVYITIDNIA